MNRSGRWAQWVLAISFVIVLVFPHLGLFMGVVGQSSEKRAMGEMPGPALLLHSPSEFARQFERFYSDAFGWRTHLIRWNNRLRLSLFQESPIKSVRVGRQGWFFYAGEQVLEDYANIMPYSDADLDRMGRIIEERRAWLEKHGIRFFILVAPNKHTVYSELLPPNIHKIGERSRLDQVAAYLKAAHPEVEFIDTREALFQAKPAQRLYDRTDTHWNDYGAFIGANVLLERIGRYFPGVRPLSLSDYTLSTEEGKGGDLAGMLSLPDIIREERITLTPRFRPRAVDGARSYPNPAQAPGREMVIKETGDPRLPRVLVFRDSFSTHMVPFLAESFQSVVFVWTFDFLAELIEREKPDVVILECVERYINALTLENPAEVKAEMNFPAVRREGAGESPL